MHCTTLGACASGYSICVHPFWVLEYGSHRNVFKHFYRPQGKVMFSQVSVCPQSASWIFAHCSVLLRSGRYASYWNAFLFEGHQSVLWGHWYPCFGLLVMSVSGFNANVDSPVCILHCLDTTDSSDSTLVQHLLTSWQLAWRPSCCDSLTCIHVLVGLKSGIERAGMLHRHHLVQSFNYECFSRQINTRITMGIFSMAILVLLR